MEELEKSTKSYIRGLLTSSPLVLTIKSLARDYKNTIGTEIEYHRMGYNSLEHFLKSIPDIVLVKGNGIHAELIPVINEKTAHINEMVTRQKTLVKNRQGRHPISKRSYTVQLYSNSNENYTNKHNNAKCPDKTPKQPVKPIKPPINKESSVEDHPNCRKSHEAVNSPNLKVYNHHKNINTGALKKVTNQSKTVNNDMYMVCPKKLQNELQDIIKKYADGIWCGELPYHYSKLFHKKLDYTSYGYRRLIDLCVDLSHIFYCVQSDNGDYKLYDAQGPLPKNKNLLSSSNDKTKDDLVSQLSWQDCENVVSGNVCKVGTVIPRQSIDHLQENEVIDVVVVEVYDPSKFWMYLNDSHLDLLMDQMQDFYKKHAREYLIPDFLIVEGLYCTQIIYGEYHRALIVDTLPDVKGHVKVLYIDYGTLARTSTDGMCYLHKKFSKLPWQQLKCRLPNIVPCDEMAPWPMTTINRFKELIKGRKIQAKIASIDRNEQILEVYLADVTDNYIFYINDKLVQEHLAQYVKKARRRTDIKTTYCPIVKNLHLFPTFTELEYGLAPSPNEMMEIYANDVPLHYCIPQYFNPNNEAEKLNMRNSEEFFKSVIALASSEPIKHDYNIDDISTAYFDFDIFGNYGQEMNDVFQEFVVFDENTNKEIRQEPESEDVLDMISENFRLTTEILLELEKGTDSGSNDLLKSKDDLSHIQLQLGASLDSDFNSNIELSTSPSSESSYCDIKPSMKHALAGISFDDPNDDCDSKFSTNFKSDSPTYLEEDFSEELYCTSESTNYSQDPTEEYLSNKQDRCKDENDKNIFVTSDVQTLEKSLCGSTHLQSDNYSSYAGQTETDSSIDLDRHTGSSLDNIGTISTQKLEQINTLSTTFSEENVNKIQEFIPRSSTQMIDQRVSPTQTQHVYPYYTGQEFPFHYSPIPMPTTNIVRPPPGFPSRAAPQLPIVNIQNFYNITPPIPPSIWPTTRYGSPSYPVTSPTWTQNDLTESRAPDFYDYYNQRFMQ